MYVFFSGSAILQSFLFIWLLESEGLVTTGIIQSGWWIIYISYGKFSYRSVTSNSGETDLPAIYYPIGKFQTTPPPLSPPFDKESIYPGQSSLLGITQDLECPKCEKRTRRHGLKNWKEKERTRKPETALPNKMACHSSPLPLLQFHQAAEGVWKATAGTARPWILTTSLALGP